MSGDTDRKALTLIRNDQIETYRNAKAAIEADRDEELSSGDVVKELARAYTGWEAKSTDGDRI
jgi:hypothetical protein